MFRKFFADLCGMCAEFPFNIRLLEKWGARGDQLLGSVGMGSGARAHREVLSDGLELVAEVVVGVALCLELGQHEGQGLPQDPLRPHRRGVRRLRQNTQGDRRDGGGWEKEGGKPSGRRSQPRPKMTGPLSPFCQGRTRPLLATSPGGGGDGCSASGRPKGCRLDHPVLAPLCLPLEVHGRSLSPG